MFDDPNLHWKTYGYVKYGELANHAARHNYHVSFAMVPMDGWYVHAETARIFRENKRWLSLLIHGNNHTSFELTQKHSDGMYQATAVQALQRIERFEKTSGIEVSRVMAAPHGACSHDMATALLQTGFEAACISRGSIMARNPDSVWPVTIGLNPAEFLGEGLPVIPRILLQRECELNMILAAFLGQPIIPVGHHEGLAGGLDLLRELAETINATGDVQWMDMGSISRSNFCTRREGDILHVKMYSRRIRLNVPEGVRLLYVHRPWLDEGVPEGLVLQNGNTDSVQFASYQGEAVPIESCTEIDLISAHPNLVNHGSVPLPRTPLWAIARRQLCEARDRLKPITDRLVKK